MLIAIVSHLPELMAKLELLRFRRSVDLIEDEPDALWTREHATSDLLASHVPPSTAHNPLDDAGE
jgi:hypothetical protein